MNQTDFNPVLVTGGSGFVGACAVHELVARGYEVHLLLRPSSNTWRLNDLWGHLHVHRSDLTDAEGIRHVLARVQPRIILHLAAHGAYESQSDARAILRTTALGTYNLLEAAVQCGTHLFVNTGSSSEYGFQSEPMQEAARLVPNSFYAIGKAAQTHLCSVIAQQTDLRVVTFRLFSVYGPWEEPTRLVPTILRRARAGLPLQMVSPDTARDFVHVNDILAALLDFPKLIELRDEIINLGTGQETTLRNFIATVMELTQSTSEVRWGAMRARHWDSNRWVADISKARALLNWRPQFTLAQGLTQMADWMKQKGDDYGGVRPLAS